MRQLQKHKFYFGSLLLIEIGCLVLILLVKGNTQLQLAYVGLAAFFYVLWGIVHHKTQHDLHIKVVIEYILMAILGFAVMFFLLQ